MTHSQHRRGDPESLKNDYVVLTMVAKGFNEKGAPEKLKKILDIFYEQSPANLGDIRTGSLCQKIAFEKIRKRVSGSATHAVFTSLDTVKGVMKSLRKANLGISVVVSGRFDDVFSAAKEVSLCPNSVGISLGIWGATDLLPSEDILQIITMCGHGMVSKNLVSNFIDKIQEGKMTPQEAGEELGRGCICGVFNPVRAAELLGKMAYGS